MVHSAGIEFIEYHERYATDAVKMWRDSKEHALGVKDIHTYEDHLNFVQNILVRENTVQLAVSVENDWVVGLLATDGEYVNQLYIHNDFQRYGIGSRFLEFAKAQSSGTLRLYTFEVNKGAQAFYEKHGFREVSRGSDNEEQLRDILYEWCV